MADALLVVWSAFHRSGSDPRGRARFLPLFSENGLTLVAFERSHDFKFELSKIGVLQLPADIAIAACPVSVT